METICGVEKTKIRKMYFSGQVNTLLNQISEKEVTEVEIKDLDTFLDSLSKESKKLKEQFSKYTDIDEMKPPSVEDLMGVDPEKKKKREEWEIERKKDHEEARKIIWAAKVAAHNGKADSEQWLQWGLDLAIYQCSLDQLRVWYDQLYRARLTQIMDVYGVSRSEAEERAKLTDEYRNYKNMALFREMVEETIMLLKKYAGITQ
jgi:hypothetical protein